MAPTEESAACNAEKADVAGSGDAIVDISGVHVLDLPDLGGAAVAATRSFQAGERVFLERALVVAAGHTNLARVRAYCLLPQQARETLREQYFSEDPGIRCAATAACRPDNAGSGDSSGDVLTILQAEGFSDLTLGEVESVIRVWNLNAYDRALGPIACKVAHSCAPNVEISVNAETGTITATACRAIAEAEILGTWYFQDTGLWWMGSDVRRALFESDRGFSCACARCQGPDTCRSLPCDVCLKGYAVPETSAGGVAAVSWCCKSCGHRGPGDAVRLKAESDLAPQVLLALRPPRHTKPPTIEELTVICSDAGARLGPRHWVTAAAALIMHYRGRPQGGALDPFSVANGCRFLGWLVDQRLPMPPAAIVRTPVSVAMACADWISSSDGKVDRRCIAGRLLAEFLLPIFDASGAGIAKVAGTGAKIEALRAWLNTMRRSCARRGCERQLSTNAAGASEDAALVATPLACGRCKQVRYCSRECQQADWKERHKVGCLPASESLAGDVAFKLLAGGP